MEKIINLFLPNLSDESSSANFYEVKNRRIFITYIFITFTVLIIFTLLNYYSGKTYAGHVDLISALIFLFLAIHYKYFGNYNFAVAGYILNGELIISLQHYLAPENMQSNLLWQPLLIMMSLYMLGPRLGFYVAIAGTLLSATAELLPQWVVYNPDTFSQQDAFIYNVMTLALCSFVSFFAAKRWLAEENVIHAKLDEQKNMYLELNQTNTALLALIGHDLSNHLSIIKGYSALLETKITDQGHRTYLSRISDTSQKIDLIIKNVKKMRAIENGKMTLTLRPVSLINAVKECLNVLEARLEEKNILVKTNFELDNDQQIFVEADEVSLSSSVINNLLSNAIKFSEANSFIEIKVLAEKEIVKLEIKDTGMGIPTDLVAHIFNMRKYTTRKGTNGESGTGLGLPLLKMFIEKYNAKIEVESRCKEISSLHGTTFIITFKRAEAPVISSDSSDNKYH
jgi:signal transduction histidine kinase